MHNNLKLTTVILRPTNAIIKAVKSLSNMVILAIDYGQKNIGLAVSDELGIIAAPLPALKVKSNQEAIEGIAFVADDIKAQSLLLGVPSGYQDIDSPITKQVRRFAENLKKYTSLPVVFWDETYSSKRAEFGARGRKRDNSHSEAARIILQEYLDYKAESKDQEAKN